MDEHLLQKVSLLIETINITVKFTCRLYFQWQTDNEINRTKQIKIDSKKSSYLYNEHIFWKKSQTLGQDILKIAVKLLSNNGLPFTPAVIEISKTELSRNKQSFEIELSKSKEIRVSCICKLVPLSMTFNEISPFKFIENGSAYGQSSRDALSKSSRKGTYQELNHIPGFNHQNEHLKRQNRELASTVRQLEKELAKNNELFDKQKNILITFEMTQKQMVHEKMEMKASIKELQRKIQDKNKKISSLQQEKVNIMIQYLNGEKEMNRLKEFISEQIQGIYNYCDHIFKQKLKQIKKIILNDSHPINKHPIEGQSNDASLSENYWIDISQEHSYNDMHQNSQEKGNKLRRNIFQREQPQFTSQKDGGSPFCDSTVKFVRSFCIKIQNTVQQNTEKLYLKIKELNEQNKAFKIMMNSKVQQKDNQFSMVEYLQQLEDGLQAQLSLVQHKERTIKNYEQTIIELTQKINELSTAIQILGEQNQRLEDEKKEIKDQLHENNFIYSIKEEEFINKIYYLETGFQKSTYDLEPSRLPQFRIVQRKEIVASSIDSSSQDSFFHRNQLIHFDAQEKQKIKVVEQRQQKIDILRIEEQNLRHTMLKKRREILQQKLKKQLTNQDQKQIQIDSMQQIQQKQQKEKEQIIEDEFLKVLV